MTHNQQEGKKNQSIEAEPEMTEMMELPGKDVKTVNVTMIHVFKR